MVASAATDGFAEAALAQQVVQQVTLALHGGQRDMKELRRDAQRLAAKTATELAQSKKDVAELRSMMASKEAAAVVDTKKQVDVAREQAHQDAKVELQCALSEQAEQLRRQNKQETQALRKELVHARARLQKHAEQTNAQRLRHREELDRAEHQLLEAVTQTTLAASTASHQADGIRTESDRLLDELAAMTKSRDEALAESRKVKSTLASERQAAKNRCQSEVAAAIAEQKHVHELMYHHEREASEHATAAGDRMAALHSALHSAQASLQHVEHNKLLVASQHREQLENLRENLRSATIVEHDLKDKLACARRELLSMKQKLGDTSKSLLRAELSLEQEQLRCTNALDVAAGLRFKLKKNSVKLPQVNKHKPTVPGEFDLRRLVSLIWVSLSVVQGLACGVRDAF